MYFHDLESFEDWQAHIFALTSKLGQLDSRINKAIEIVKEYHNQPRTITKGNYNRHPLRVARILSEEMNVLDEQSILIALCHDLGEWSDYDINNLKLEFGDEVYKGVQILTWNQKDEWSDFVDGIVNSGIDNLVAIKIADKLDNNRAISLSGSDEEKIKARNKTVEVILPLVEKHYPAMVDTYHEVLNRLK